MKNKLVLLGSLLTLSTFGSSLQSVKVSGEGTAEVSFDFLSPTEPPVMTVEENTVSLSFNGSSLSDALQGKVDLLSPHTLVQRISAFATEKGAVRAQVVVNGTSENLKQRLHLKKEGNSVRLAVDFPAGASQATLKLLQQEQAPIAPTEVAKKPSESATSPSFFKILIALLVFGAAGGGSYAFARFLKKKGHWRGSRKYLIETLAYVPVGTGTKTGVGLLKIGTEFVLVGISPGQVSYLSSLPKLAEQFEQDSRFERDSFREAVQEEVSRMKTSTVKKAGLSA